jgi:peptidoglycan/LPS O-acetylase OafA/YrhL
MNFGIGCWRFFLAFLVVISHLWKGMIGGPAAYAVWGFYVLSGYLMTLVLNEKYGPSINGLKRYAYNRFLRIYPLYWIASALGLLALIILPSYGISLSSLNPQFVLPLSLADYWHNITLIPVFGGGNFLVPVSGALATEIGAYILMPIIAFSRLAAFIGLILSLIVNIRLGLTIDDHALNFAMRYSSFWSCYIAFAFGSLTYQFKDKISNRFMLPYLSIVVWVAHSLLSRLYFLSPWTFGLYASIPLSSWVVISLIGKKTGKLDKLLGDLSYPVYLLHSGVAVWFLFYFNNKYSFSFFTVSFLVTIFVSLVMIKIDNQIAAYKK